MVKEIEGLVKAAQEKNVDLKELLEAKISFGNALFILYAKEFDGNEKLNLNVITHLFRKSLGVEEKDYSDDRAWYAIREKRYIKQENIKQDDDKKCK